MTKKIYRQGNSLVIPGLATAHSHAFQRALRGRTQRRSGAAGSFWSWRDLMYELAAKLDPDDIFNISRFAFVELAMSGVTAVGEFHYVHHSPDGTPYPERTHLADQVICAAKEAGMRITLIRTAYLRGGYNQAPEGAQKRFCDATVEEVLQDVETLRHQYENDPMVRVGVAAHSIRAVPVEAVTELAGYARSQRLPFHMHVAEQQREIEECLAEYGARPVQLLAGKGVLDANFTGIHATHLTDDEIAALGDAGARVCLCRTTERDLGDGLPMTAELVRAGVNVCIGVDSHASADAFEEIRAVELDERSRTERRHVAAEAPLLLEMGTRNGLNAIGMAEAYGQDSVRLDLTEPSLAGFDEQFPEDAVVFAATPRAVDKVELAGEVIVENGKHIAYQKALDDFHKTLARLGL